jgi:SAM-dependent methyltransferase
MPLTAFGTRAAELAQDLDSRSRNIYDKAIRHIDPENVALMQQKYHEQLVKFDRATYYKYLDIPYWIRDKIRYAIKFHLDEGEPQSILDIGTGAGHFLAIADALGHHTLGIDIDVPIYHDLCKVLSVRRQSLRVEHGKRLGNLGRRFNLVTAFATLFYTIDQNKNLYWSIPDWAFFIRDLFDNQLKFPAMIFFELNRRGGLGLDLDFMHWIEKKGAKVNYDLGTVELIATEPRHDF